MISDSSIQMAAVSSTSVEVKESPGLDPQYGMTPAYDAVGSDYLIVMTSRTIEMYSLLTGQQVAVLANSGTRAALKTLKPVCPLSVTNFVNRLQLITTCKKTSDSRTSKFREFSTMTVGFVNGQTVVAFTELDGAAVSRLMSSLCIARPLILDPC